MKQEINDEKWARLLKEGAHDPGENPWFTPRVMNKLPARRRPWGVLAAVFFVVALATCVLCWDWFLRGDFSVVTMRDVFHFVALALVTAFVLLSVVAAALKRSL